MSKHKHFREGLNFRGLYVVCYFVVRRTWEFAYTSIIGFFFMINLMVIQNLNFGHSKSATKKF